MNTKDTAKILYNYVVLGYSQEEVANLMPFQITTSKISETVRGYGFNQTRASGWQSGQDRGKYKTYKGFKVTEDIVHNFVCSDYQFFHEYLEALYQQTMTNQRANAERKRKEEESRRQQAEEERRLRLEQQRRQEEEQRLRQEAQRRRQEEERRQEIERQRRAEEQRRQEEALQQQRKDQIDRKVHIQWMNRGIELVKDNDFAEALRYAKASYNLLPMYGNIYTIAEASYHLELYEDALNMINALIKEGKFRFNDCKLLRAKIYNKSFQGWATDFIQDVDFLLEQGVNIDEFLYNFAAASENNIILSDRDKPLRLYEECVAKGIRPLKSNLALTSLYYERNMWQETINAYINAENSCETNIDWDTYYFHLNHWKLGLCYHYLGDSQSAYLHFRHGLALLPNTKSPHNEEYIPPKGELKIFFDCLRQAGDHESIRRYQDELNRRQRFLNGKMTAYGFFGDRYNGVNYRYVYNSYTDKWEQDYAGCQEGIVEKISRFFRF